MRRFAQVFVLVALAAVGIAAGAVLAPGGSASPSAAVATTRVTVTATEFKFKLSRTNVPVGTVIFTIVNKGKIGHDFKVAGKKTPTIAPGKSATLTVKFTKNGKFPYLCTLLGHASAGMKGVLQVGGTPVTVTATEFKFKLSRLSVPIGPVTFTVTNKGKIAHDFRILGKKTPTLSPGKSYKLTVNFAKKGRYPFLCTLLGHAGAGMRGTFSVASAPVTTPPPTTTTPTTTTTPPPPPTGTVGTATSTVTVSMTDYAFTFSQASVPSGQVTFIIKNNGNDVHNFDITGVKAGAILSPGQSETWTVGLPAKSPYTTVCDVPFHIDRGMTAAFTVTP